MGSSLSLGWDLNREKEFQILLLFSTSHSIILEIFISITTLLHLFLEADDMQKENNSSYGTEFLNAIADHPMSLVIFI